MLSYANIEDIRDWASFVMGIISIVISIMGFVFSKKASKEAKSANDELKMINKNRKLASEWESVLLKIESDETTHVNELISLIVRVSNQEDISDDDKWRLHQLKSRIETNKDFKSFHKQLLADMAEAEGYIRAIIDRLYV